MNLRYILLFFLLIYSINLYSQVQVSEKFIPDSAFVWTTVQESCSKPNEVQEIFVTVSEPPKLNIQKDQIGAISNQYVSKSNTESDFFKMKLIISPEGHVCYQSIGSTNKNENLNDLGELSRALTDGFHFTPGRQNNRAVLCQSLLYIKIENGLATAIWTKNLVLD